MTVARIAAIALALSACTAFAQERPATTLIVVVTDQSGAVIPGARIVATDQATGSRFDAVADTTGQAIVHLDKGTYELRVQAGGFQLLLEPNVEMHTETHKEVTLRISSWSSGPVVSGGPEIPLEYQPVAAELPLIPMQQLAAPAKPVHPRPHWF
jgi:hypothetical protein